MKLTCDCGKVIRIPDQPSGKRLRCPACGAVVPRAKADTGEDQFTRRNLNKRTGSTTRAEALPLWKKPLFLAGAGGGLLSLIILILVLASSGGDGSTTPDGQTGGVLGPEKAIEATSKLRLADSRERAKAQQELRTLWPELTPAAKEATTNLLDKELDDPAHKGAALIVALLQNAVEANLAMPVLEKQLLDKQRTAPKHPLMLRLIEAYFHHAQSNSYSAESARTVFLACAARMDSGYARDYKTATAAWEHAKARLKSSSKQAVPLLVAAVEERQPGYAFAISLRGDMGAEAAVAVPALRQILQKPPDPTVQLTTIRARGEIGVPAAAAFPDLLNLVKSHRSLQIAQEAIPKLVAADKVDVPSRDALLQSQEDRNSIFFHRNASLVLWILRGLEKREQEARPLADRLRILQKNVDQQMAVHSRPYERKRVTVFVKGKVDKEATERARDEARKQAELGEKARQRFHADLMECHRLLQRALEKASRLEERDASINKHERISQQQRLGVALPGGVAVVLGGQVSASQCVRRSLGWRHRLARFAAAVKMSVERCS
ncbi:MAG: hypothetical protein FJ271_17645 [Planctomycetes bacterium]|nr:hypothetical protein [Planctomycetota bacterium]